MIKFFTFLGFVLLSNNFMAQDSMPLPKEHFPHLLKMKADLNEPVAKFPITYNDDIFVKDFGQIEKAALQVKNSLELFYVEHFSGTGKEINFDNYYLLTAQVSNLAGDDIRLIAEDIRFEIDPTGESTILKNRTPELQGMSASQEINSITLNSTLDLKTGDELNKNGMQQVKIRFLTGYDTIKLHKDQIGENFEIRNKTYRLENILNGNLFLKNLDSLPQPLGDDRRSQDGLLTSGLKFITFKNGQKTYTPSFDGNFSNSSQIYSGLLNDKLVRLTDQEYEAYLSRLVIYKKKEWKMDLTILPTDIDYDQIWFLLPKYEYLKQTVGGNIQTRLQDGDGLRIMSHSMSLDEEKPVQVKTIKK